MSETFEWKDQDFNALTVLELRKVAKSMGVVLGAGISKAGIVEKLNRARTEKYGIEPTPASAPAKTAAKETSEAESPVKPIHVAQPRKRKVDAAETVAPAKSAASSEAPAATAASTPADTASAKPDDMQSEKKPDAPAASKPTTQADAAKPAQPAASNFRPAYQAPATPPRFGSKPAYQASANSFSNRPGRMPSNDFSRPARPANYTRFGPAAQTESTDDRSFRADSPRPANNWDRRPAAYGSDLPDRRAAYGSDTPDRRPAYGSDLPDRRSTFSGDTLDRRAAYSSDTPDRRPAYGSDVPRYTRSYDTPARPTAYGAPQRDMPSDLQNLWAGSPSDMLSPAECQDGSGILELHPDGYGFLRGAALTPSSRDIYVSMAQVRRFSLRTGDLVVGKVRPQRDGDKYSAMLYITEVNGLPADAAANRPAFDDLTPCYPHEHISLEVEGDKNEFIDMRLIDLIAPIGFGQRALIHCPPAADKARLLSAIANAASICHPDAVVMTLLLGGTPEDATLYRDHTPGQVVASTFDQAPENHLRIADLVLERAERLVEMKKDVILLVDSLTYLSKVYTTAAVQQGRQTIGMVNPASLQKAKRLFGAARCLREGGSLTIFAVMNIETGNRVDDSIAEDLKGTANMELVLDTATARAGIYPPVNLMLSGTKRAELIASKEQLDGIQLIHEMLGSLRAVDMIPQLLSMLEKTSSNDDLLVRIKDWAALMKQ